MLIVWANKRDPAKSSPTFKALDFVEILPKDLGAAGAGLCLGGLGVRVRVRMFVRVRLRMWVHVCMFASAGARAVALYHGFIDTYKLFSLFLIILPFIF